MKDRQIAVITGGSAGVGRATARLFAENGYDVAILARGTAGLKGAAGDVKQAGGRALAIPTDVSQFDQVANAATRIEEEWGEIDVWVNDAMTTVFAPTSDVKPADFQRAVEVTFLGQVWGTMAALSHMRPRDRGTIVNVGSALAFMGIPLQAAYCSSKFACRGFFESTRAELLHEGSHVHLSMVHLPAVNTPQFDWCETTLDRHPQPVPPIYQPEIPARLILEAALTGRRSRVVGSWNKLLVAAGQLFPGLGNQYAALGAWDTQLTDQPLAADRPVNLYEAADADRDHGAHGMFDDKAGGFLDPSFLKSLPTTARTFVEAVSRTAAERRRVRAAAASSTTSPLASSPRSPLPPESPPPKREEAEAYTNRKDEGKDQHVDASQLGDALDVLVQETGSLQELFEIWDASDPQEAEEPVIAAWDHGTVGKLILEHGAIHLAAHEDIVRVLENADEALAAELRSDADTQREILDRLDHFSRGVNPVQLGPEFAEVLAEFRQHSCKGGGNASVIADGLAAALGTRRTQLRSAEFVRKHAPTHPGRHHWYQKSPAAVRFQAFCDRLRDIPGAQSGLGNQKLAERYATP